MANLKNSKQRDAILRSLQCRYDHPTAEQIYLDLKQEYPSLSLATVYRNLNLLVEHGVVMRIPTVEADRFDGNSQLHYHFHCNVCGDLIDISINQPDFINSLPNDFDGEITSHSLMFHGVCSKCMNNPSISSNTD